MTTMTNPLASTPPPNAPVARRKPGRPAKEPHVSLVADFTPPEDSSEVSFPVFISSADAVVRERYARTLDKNEALSELARLRRICEMAAEEINTRLVPDESKCLMCGTELRPGQKVTMMANLKDEASGIVTTHPICSIECVRQYNRKRMGLAQIPDQGHVRE